MTAQTKLVIALIGSAALATWGAYQFFAATIDPVIRGLCA